MIVNIMVDQIFFISKNVLTSLKKKLYNFDENVLTEVKGKNVVFIVK